MACKVDDTRLGLAPRRDILMGGNPAPSGKWIKNNLDGPAILLLDNIDLMLVLGHHVQALAKVAFRILAVAAGLHAMGENLGQRRSRPDELFRQLIEIDKAAIAGDQALVGVEHAQSLGHIVQVRIR